MGKKKSRSTQTSKGERRCVARDIVKATRRDYMQSSERTTNQLAAFLKGKNVMLTIPNPNKNETNKRFIRVPAAEQWRRGGKSKV
jgi:hypothetical protein